MLRHTISRRIGFVILRVKVIPPVGGEAVVEVVTGVVSDVSAPVSLDECILYAVICDDDDDEESIDEDSHNISRRCGPVGPESTRRIGVLVASYLKKKKNHKFILY